jgi:hypothetical protein
MILGRNARFRISREQAAKIRVHYVNMTQLPYLDSENMMPLHSTTSTKPGRVVRLLAAIVAALAVTGTAMAASSTLIRSQPLYASPSSASKSLLTVPKGSRVEIQSRTGGWVQVTYQGHKGWVRLLSLRSGTSGGSALGDVVGLTQKRDNKVVAVAGLRGLDEEDLKRAHFNADELNRLDQYQTSASSAERFARAGKLSKRNVAFLPKPQASKPAATPWEGFQ